MHSNLNEIANEMELLAGILPDAYLVGGFVRNLLSGKTSFDVDIAVKGGAREISKSAGEKISGSWFPLDESRDIYRVVLKKENEWFFDFTPMGGGIRDNLIKRDFTVDAVALPLKEWRKPAHFVDPTGGTRDVKDRIIRMTGSGVFADDPLRLYRAFRIALQLGAQIEPETLEEIRRNVSLIKGVAGERIRAELYGILSAAHSADTLNMIYDAGLLSATFSEFSAFKDTTEHYYHKGGLWEHSLETLRKFEDEVVDGGFSGFSEFRKELVEYFSEGRDILTKIACLLHDIGKPETARRISGRLRFFGHERMGRFLSRNIMRRLMASRRDTNFVCEVVTAHMRPSNLSSRSTKRAVHRFFNAFRTQAHIASLFTAYCDRYSYESVNPSPREMHRQAEFTKNMLKAYFRREETSRRPPLVNGNEIMERLKIGPGRLVGRLLGEIKEAQAEGRVGSREEALALAEKLRDKVALMDATVIVPAYNEEKTIGGILSKVCTAPGSWEIIVVDDGSSDGTAAAARRFARVSVVSHEKNLGKGTALRTGVKLALGKYIAVQDADGEYDFAQLRSIVEFAIKEDLPAVYGSRFMVKNPVRYWRYYLGNQLVSFFIGLIFFRSVTDSYTCYKIVRADIMKAFGLKSRGFEIESEITSKLLKKGFGITEVPISYIPRSEEEGKKIRPLDGAKALVTALKIRLGFD